jgi:hypothetical protein
MCSTAKTWIVTEATESNFNQKERLYKFTSDHFDEFEPLTQAILDNNFQFSLNAGTLNSVEINSADTAKITFDSFEDDMEVTISVRNATLRETFISATQSDAIKILIDESYTFSIENPVVFSEGVVAATKTTGQVIGSSNMVTEKSGIAVSILTIFANVRISGAMLKAI